MIHRLPGMKPAKVKNIDIEIDRRVMGFDRSLDLAVPPYSSKWAYAFEVVEQLSPRWGFSLAIVGEQHFVTFMERLPIVEGQGKTVKATGLSGPQAICLAALNAVGSLR